MKVYVITCNKKLSSKGFATIQGAIKWLVYERNCEQVFGWTFRDKTGMTYLIHEIGVE